MSRAAPSSRWFFHFGNGEAEGDGSLRELLGGKGAGLADMTRAGIPVPPGFTITTEACRFFDAHKGALPEGFEDGMRAALDRLEVRLGKKLGDPRDPLLVSVRSGAAVSMPGMMDTILNLGLNDRSVRGLAARTGDPRFAWDCYRRFLHMFGEVVLALPRAAFDEPLEALKRRRRAISDADLSAEDQEALVARRRRLSASSGSSKVALGIARTTSPNMWRKRR